MWKARPRCDTPLVSVWVVSRLLCSFVTCLLVLLLALYLYTEWVLILALPFIYIYIGIFFLFMSSLYNPLQLSPITLSSWFFFIVVDYFWHFMFRIYCYFLGSSGHGFYFSYFQIIYFGWENWERYPNVGSYDHQRHFG